MQHFDSQPEFIGKLRVVMQGKRLVCAVMRKSGAISHTDLDRNYPN